MVLDSAVSISAHNSLNTPLTMSSPQNPSASLSDCLQTAEVRVVSSWQWPRSKHKAGYVLISSRIYWKVENKDATSRPQSLDDLRNADSLELIRLEHGTWNEVDEIVKVDKYEGRTRITVRGRLHGRKRRNNLFIVRDVEIEIIPNTPEHHEVWVSKIRARVAPWNLLEQEINDVASHVPSSGVKKLEKTLGGLGTSIVSTNLSSTSAKNVAEKWSDNLATLPEQMEKLSIVDELLAHGSAAVETGVTLAKLVTSVERVAETAEGIADVSKCVAGVSTIFHLVALTAHGVSMCAEANRGRRVLPVALGRIVILLRYVLESLAEIMKPSRSVNKLDKDFVFNVLRQTVCAMDLAETQLLRGRGSQIMNAEDVKVVERKIKELEPLVVIASNTSRICTISEELTQLKKEQGIWGERPHHVRPSVSAFFSGRKKELNTLKDILEKWGSAAITQYGGVGKTELMVAFADRAERDEQVRGGVFWVTVDGGEKDVIGSLAGLADKLAGRKMDEEERQNGNLVVAALQRGLDKREGRWLLCLDNADDSKVGGILNEVCGIAGRTPEKGWVVVTSRQGQPHIWSRMKSEQKLVLGPLCAEDAMVALWRQIQKIETWDVDDDGVMNTIKELERDEVHEYQALKELCGDEGACSLGGLPLALVQAGSYMARFECSFAEYLNMFQNTNRSEVMQDIMKNTEEMNPIRESQRSIWTTWKISVQQLSVKASTVLRAMAMLGSGGVEEAILKSILKGVAGDEGGYVGQVFRNIVIGELVHGSSLICRAEGEREGQEGRVYKMHRLVRRFILSDMERGSALWNEVYNFALVSVHKLVETELENDGKSFKELAYVSGNSHRVFAAHATALVGHYTLPAQDVEIGHFSKVDDIHRYSGRAMEFMGKAEEEVQVWERLLDILLHRQSANRKSSNENLSDTSHHENQGEEVESRIASVYNSLGGALVGLGRLYSAALHLEQSLEMYQVIHGHGKPHAHTAASLDNLGSVYRRMGKLDKALERHEQSLEMRQAVHGHDMPHRDIAMSLNYLGIVYEIMGKRDKALENHERGLKMYRAIHGHGRPHPDIAMSLNNLGLVYKGMGKLDKALEKYEQSLEIRQAIHGHKKPHPDIAMSLTNLGNVYELMDKLDKALDKHERGLKMYLVIHGYGKPHSDIASSLNNLGIVYEKMGELDKALEKHELSLEMFRAVHGHNKTHPDVAMSLANLGNVYYRMDKLEKALEKHEQSQEMYQAIHGHGNPHPDIASSLCNLGLVYEGMGEPDKALVQHKQSLEMYQAIHGHGQPHSDTASSFNNLGDAYEQLGELGKALENYERSLEMYRTIHKDKPHLDIAISLWHIGLVYHKQKKLNHAADFLEQSLEMLRIVHARHPLHPDITEIQRDLGEVTEDQGRQDEGLAILERLNGADESSDGESSIVTSEN